MIKFLTGDIFKANVEAIVNPVNCVGVMGKGLALEFKNRFPENFSLYKDHCDRRLLHPGDIFVTRGHLNENGQTVINLASKNHWRDPSEYDWVYDGISQTADFIIENDIRSIAIPALGCGLGGLEWESVKSYIIWNFEDEVFNDVEIFVYEPL